MAAFGFRRKKGDNRAPGEIPESERDYYLERKYPSFGNLAPRDISSRSAKEVCDEGRGIGPRGLGVYLDFADAIKRLGEPVIRERYGNLFEIYHEITNEDAYKGPMRIYPRSITPWVGFGWTTTSCPICPASSFWEKRISPTTGANRLGASALMQGLADGYFVVPLHDRKLSRWRTWQKTGHDRPEFKEVEDSVRARTQRFLSIKGRRSVDHFHRELGRIMSGTTAACRAARRAFNAPRADPAVTRGVLEKPERSWRRRSPERRTRKGWARR
jgi:succinate dehydrogenase / fumarate reductase flavoprotein subunit